MRSVFEWIALALLPARPDLLSLDLLIEVLPFGNKDYTRQLNYRRIDILRDRTSMTL